MDRFCIIKTFMLNIYMAGNTPMDSLSWFGPFLNSHVGVRNITCMTLQSINLLKLSPQAPVLEKSMWNLVRLAGDLVVFCIFIVLFQKMHCRFEPTVPRPPALFIIVFSVQYLSLFIFTPFRNHVLCPKHLCYCPQCSLFLRCKLSVGPKPTLL